MQYGMHRECICVRAYPRIAASTLPLVNASSAACSANVDAPFEEGRVRLLDGVKSRSCTLLAESPCRHMATSLDQSRGVYVVCVGVAMKRPCWESVRVRRV